MTPSRADGFEAFSGGNSVLHRMDPRAKLVMTLVWALPLAVFQDLRVLLFACGFGAALAAAARLPKAALARRMLLVNLFCGFLWLFLPWSTPGATLAQWGLLTLTHEGVALALRLTLRCNAIVAVTIALLGTSRAADVARALQTWGAPDKLALALYFCVRYIQTLGAERLRLSNAMRLRGFQPRADAHTYRTYGNLVGLLFLRGRDRAERAYEAMRCRGFTGRLHALGPRHVQGRDWLMMTIWLGMTATLAVIEWRMTN